MKHVLKSLKNQGIFVPQYEPKKFKITLRGETVPLSPKSEQMAVAWIRKRQSALSPPDKVFMKNFMRGFLEQLKLENPLSEFLESFASDYLTELENYEANDFGNPSAAIHREIDFKEIEDYLDSEKQKKLSLTQTEKKQLAQQRKAAREKLKRDYG